MKYFLSLLFSIACLSLLFFSCEDYIESGIEGQWQMTKTVKADGSEQRVDSIYYLFKTGVFKYIRMETDLDSFFAFGLYSESNNQLKLSVSDFWTEPNDAGLYWGIDNEGNYIIERTYNIKRKTSSALELEFQGERYIFRKY